LKGGEVFMAKIPETPEEPMETSGEPIPEREVSSDEEAVVYEETTAPSAGMRIPEIPVLASEDVEAGSPEEDIKLENDLAPVEEAASMSAEEMLPTEVSGIPEIPVEDSWSEVVYEEGEPPPGFQSFET
jgi:hypothetical protein